jgi:PleD family two-component response regulator
MAATNEKKKILLVDDDEIHVLAAESMLKNEYEVFTAKSGKEALDHLIHGLVPHLLLLDILMPDMDGWETFNRIKAISTLQDVPIVFLTSLTDTTEEKRAFELGAADYITKPYDKDVLLDRVKKILEKSTKNNEEEFTTDHTNHTDGILQ